MSCVLACSARVKGARRHRNILRARYRHPRHPGCVMHSAMGLGGIVHSLVRPCRRHCQWQTLDSLITAVHSSWSSKAASAAPFRFTASSSPCRSPSPARWKCSHGGKSAPPHSAANTSLEPHWHITRLARVRSTVQASGTEQSLSTQARSKNGQGNWGRG